MLFTKEEIIEFQKAGRNYPFNFVITDKHYNFVYCGTQNDIIAWVKKNCFEENVIKNEPWKYRILNFIFLSVNKKQKYKGYYFHLYDKKWERKMKIEKLLNSENVIHINHMQRS